MILCFLANFITKAEVVYDFLSRDEFRHSSVLVGPNRFVPILIPKIGTMLKKFSGLDDGDSVGGISENNRYDRS